MISYSSIQVSLLLQALDLVYSDDCCCMLFFTRSRSPHPDSKVHPRFMTRVLTTQKLPSNYVSSPDHLNNTNPTISALKNYISNRATLSKPPKWYILPTLHCQRKKLQVTSTNTPSRQQSSTSNPSSWQSSSSSAHPPTSTPSSPVLWIEIKTVCLGSSGNVLG